MQNVIIIEITAQFRIILAAQAEAYAPAGISVFTEPNRRRG